METNRQNLQIYNTMSKEKQTFEPLNYPNVGMYVCGPTVYSDIHLGNIRTYTSFDLIFRYLTHLGYKVRYVRNITDAGHLVGDGDQGDDKISTVAKLHQIEPMEIVQKYTNIFHDSMNKFNILSPSIEPTATGHIVEQMELVKEILNKGYAYIVNGSVYFDVEKYNLEKEYGALSGRNIEELRNHTRELDGQDEKRSKFDFALWIKAKTEHLMKWPSPWSIGFPGWHLECSAMSHKYLGKQFDIHGGGMDLIPTHHTNEVAQNEVAFGLNPAKYWVHTNMLTIDGKKMSKSLGNVILTDINPMSLRFFMLQSHYRSTLDFSLSSIEASEKGLKRLISSYVSIDTLPLSKVSNIDSSIIVDKFYSSMDDDFNSPILIAELFEVIKILKNIKEGSVKIDRNNLDILKSGMYYFIEDVLGIRISDIDVELEQKNISDVSDIMDIVLQIRSELKSVGNYPLADSIRNRLKDIDIEIKDTKTGTKWSKL